MRLPDENGDIRVFASNLLNVVIHVEGDITSEKARLTQRIEDSDGAELTGSARFHSVNDNEFGNRWIDIECPSLGILGPFSAYPRFPLPLISTPSVTAS